MFGLIIFLLVAWVALSIVGAVVKGLFWLTVVGVVLFLGTAGYAALKHRSRRQLH